MELIERLVGTWMASGRDEEIEETVKEISHGGITLIDVVKALGEYLTSEEDELRTKGVDFLSSVLGSSPINKLNQQSVRVLTAFYCKKLDDTETIVPALRGLKTLANLPTCSPAEATIIIQAILLHVKMRALVQSVRFSVFSIIDALMAQNRDALKAIGKAFVAGYVSLVEGEKDPRNLLTVFAITRVILIEFDTSDHVESLFNITFCYFPITFKPPPNDPYGITTDDLRLALRGCLNALPSFGPLAIPLFLEKLIAGSPSTKRDTLQAMAVCLPVYGSALARSSAHKLWSSIKLEVFQPTDALTEDEALKTIRVLIETIYSDDENTIGSNDDMQGLAMDVCEECLYILREPEKSQAKPAIRILCTFMATTSSVSSYTLSQAIPHLLKLFSSTSEIPNRPPILLLLADLINATCNSTEKVMLTPYKDELLGAVSVGLKSAPSCLPALAVLRGLVTQKSLLSDDELRFAVHLVNETFQSTEGDDNDFSDSAIISMLTTISIIASHHVREQTLPLLFSSLPDSGPVREATKERAKCWRTLSALSSLCVHPALFETLVIRLTTKLDLICVPKPPRDVPEDAEPNAAYAHSLLKTIADTLSKKIDAGHSDVAKYIESLVPRLYNLFFYSALQLEKNTVANNPRLISIAGSIIMLVTQCLPIQRQRTFLVAIYEALSSGNIQKITEGFHKVPSDVRLLLFEDSATTAQKNLLVLLTAGILTSHNEIQPPVSILDGLLDRVLTWSLVGADNNLQRESAWHLISSIVNKHAECTTGFLNKTIDCYWPQKIANADIALEKRRQAVEAWVWISKSLIICNHPLSMCYIDRLFELLNDGDIGWDAGRAIGKIAGSDPILTKRHHAVIKVLHTQKFVNSVLSRIIAGTKDSSRLQQAQNAYLVALTSLVRAVPKAMYTHEMSTLIPLLLRGLELPEVNIRANVIGTFLAAAEGEFSDQHLISEHASTLVTYMLKNSMFKDMPSAPVRILALQYLRMLPNIVRYDVLHPYKPTVLRELAKALDDPKRSVRKEAIDARTIWFQYNG